MAEQLQEIEVLSRRVYGRPFALLDEDEKQAIYRAYDIERGEIEQRYLMGEELMSPDPAAMIQTGDLYHANVGGALGNLGQSVAGAYVANKARKDLQDLARDYQTGSEAAGEAVQFEASRPNILHNRLMADQIRAGSQPSAAAPPPPTQARTQVRQAPPPAAQLMPVVPQGQQVEPVQFAGGQPRRQQANARMVGMLRGQNTTSDFRPDISLMPPQLPEPTSPEELARRRRMEMAMRMRGY